MTLEPRLTRLDEQVLAQLRGAGEPGRRSRAVHASVVVKHYPRSGGEPAPDHRTVLEVLRGFEHLGRVQQRNGFWKKSS